MTIEEIKDSQGQFKRLDSQEAKWQFLLSLSDMGNDIFFELDSDITTAFFAEDVDYNYPLSFKDFIGCDDGVYNLLAALGFYFL